MTTPFKLFMGGPVGSGRQWFSWAQLDDVIGAYLFALEHEAVRGPINVVGPEAVRQKDFALALGKALGRPSWAPVPGPMLRLAVGELAAYLLRGRRAVPAALERLGYVFKHAELGPALAASL
jgi:NAD dependent epimerase/dehydratase family enzyme